MRVWFEEEEEQEQEEEEQEEEASGTGRGCSHLDFVWVRRILKQMFLTSRIIGIKTFPLMYHMRLEVSRLFSLLMEMD